MATRLCCFLSAERSIFNIQPVRHGHYARGKPPTAARCLKERLQELKDKEKDKDLRFQVNIGYCPVKINRNEIMDKWITNVQAVRADTTMEQKSRKKDLLVDLENVREDWLKTIGPSKIKMIADHYGIFKDLYGDAYFLPVVPLIIDYNLENDNKVARVFNGNVIKPKEASASPVISYDAKPETLWSLIMTTPDGNFGNPENEYCHWFIGNIPGNNLKQGEQLIDYLGPITPRGIGYYRYIYVLYKQNKHIDFSEYKRSAPWSAPSVILVHSTTADPYFASYVENDFRTACSLYKRMQNLDLTKRDWNTQNFYRKYQDSLTPAGLAFFQADWDESVRNTYHEKLDMKEPSFEYDFPEPYVKPQEWFPLKEAFNSYLDKYRDPKQINKEFLLRKLSKVHPFKILEPPLKYPNAQPLPKDMPSWLKLERRKERLNWGRVRGIE